MNTFVEEVWAGAMFREDPEHEEKEYVWVEVELHVDPQTGDLGFYDFEAGGSVFRKDQEGEWYSTPQRAGRTFEGRVCDLPGSVREALRPWRAGGWTLDS